MAGHTKRNHYFPKGLMRLWIDKTEHPYPNNIWTCDKLGNIKERGLNNICRENNQYTQNTENLTSKDDDELVSLIREIEKTEQKIDLLLNPRLLQLVFKLLCRIKAINDIFAEETYKHLTYAKELYTPDRLVGNGLTTNKLLKQAVNFHLLTEDNDDWRKMEYHFFINRTKRKFVFPDDIKKTLILSLSPNLCVGFSVNKHNKESIPIEIVDIGHEETILEWNRGILSNSNEFVGCYHKDDLFASP